MGSGDKLITAKDVEEAMDVSGRASIIITLNGKPMSYWDGCLLLFYNLRDRLSQYFAYKNR